jgi:uncharacterized membrane protein
MAEIGTARIETFSDGVFAIAATLLILEIGVHTTRGAQLGHELTRIWPSYLAYVTSFVTIGIIWINHHHNMRAIDHIDRTFMFINLLLLLDVAFIPFPTKLVADYRGLLLALGDALRQTRPLTYRVPASDRPERRCRAVDPPKPGY